MEAKERTLLYYESANGQQPFRDWRKRFDADQDAKAAIDARLTRLERGNFGKSEPVGEGVSESKVDLGPGYRIYYAVDGGQIILLCGGDKSSQQSDIETAKHLWKNYKEWKKQNAKK